MFTIIFTDFQVILNRARIDCCVSFNAFFKFAREFYMQFFIYALYARFNYDVIRNHVCNFITYCLLFA